MSNAIPHYFYAPTWDFPPDGPIQLGNVLTSVLEPEQPLHQAPYPSPEEIISSEKRQVEFSKEKLRAGKFAMLLKFLSLFGVGIDASVEWNKSKEEFYTFKQIETTQFFPTKQYIEKCITVPLVSRYLEKSRYRKPVYIITGLKTVSGCSAKSHRARVVDGKLGAEVDVTILSGGMAPIGVGPATEGKRKDEEGMSWEESSDFIFAFQVQKITVERKTGDVTRKDYTKGAMLGQERGKASNKNDELAVTSIGNVDAKELGFRENLIEDDEDKVIVYTL